MVPKEPARTFSSLQDRRSCKQGSGGTLQGSAPAARLGHRNPNLCTDEDAD